MPWLICCEGSHGRTARLLPMKRRHDLIPNLVNTVRGAMEFERDTLTQVMEARARAVSATGPADAASAVVVATTVGGARLTVSLSAGDVLLVKLVSPA